jgi:choline kinase
VTCVDTHPKAPLSTTSVKLRLTSDYNILGISDRLKTWDAIDTGFFQGTEETFTILFFLEKTRYKIPITDVVRIHTRNHTAKAIVINGDYWVNINTPEILSQAKRTIILEYPHLLPPPPHEIPTPQPHPLLWESTEASFDA